MKIINLITNIALIGFVIESAGAGSGEKSLKNK
jgi:hypothetical protein